MSKKHYFSNKFSKIANLFLKLIMTKSNFKI